MSSGAIELSVNGHDFSFQPSQKICPDCGEGAGYESNVDVTTDADETDVSVTFRCVGCEVAVETVSETVAGAPEDPQEDAGDGQVVIEWIEEYAEAEGRHPSKSKCVQDLPFEIFEAQELLEELLAEDRIEEAEELRAGGKITVYRPT